jgi:hypothetical protein
MADSAGHYADDRFLMGEFQGVEGPRSEDRGYNVVRASQIAGLAG